MVNFHPSRTLLILFLTQHRYRYHFTSYKIHPLNDNDIRAFRKIKSACQFPRAINNHNADTFSEVPNSESHIMLPW